MFCEMMYNNTTILINFFFFVIFLFNWVLFFGFFFSINFSLDHWLINNGCTNHMTFDKSLFKTLQPIRITKVWIGNDNYITSKGKWTIAISTHLGTKTISNVLYVPDIDQNLLSVGQLIKKEIKVTFKDKSYHIFYITRYKILQAKMRGKRFSFLPYKEEHITFSTNINNTKVWHKRMRNYHL